MQSVYRWNGKIESAEEFLLLIKTGEQMFERLQSAIRDLHSYELPECIVVRIENGGAEYLKWLAEGLE
jgi:periplasmic divalent cation tolerance protein